MVQRVSWILCVLLAAMALAVSGCEDKAADEGAQKETAGEEGGEGAAEALEPDEEFLQAMGEVADKIAGNFEDPEKAISAARTYHDKNEERLQGVVERLKAKNDAMTPEEQDAFMTEFTAREEYVKFDGIMRRFEDTYPDNYGELEELMDTIQSAGSDEGQVEVEEGDSVDVDAAFEAGEAKFAELQGKSITGATLEALEAAFAEVSAVADEAHGQYEVVFQNTQNPDQGVQALVRAASLYELVAKKIREMTTPEAIDATAFEALREKGAAPLEKRALELYGAALRHATENAVDSEFSKQAKSRLEAAGAADDGVAPPDGDDGAAPPEGDGADPADGDGAAPAEGGDAPPAEGEGGETGEGGDAAPAEGDDGAAPAEGE